MANDVILVHGMGRTPLSFFPLARRLRRHGFRCHFFAYIAAFESFDTIAARLARFNRQFGNDPWIGVGHSLGGLLLRVAMARNADTLPKPRHLLCLGTPNHSPRLARRLRDRWWFRLWNGDCGQMLGDPIRMESLPLSIVPTTIVAGTAGWYGRWSPFGDEANDSVVSVSEATLAGAELIQLPVQHTFMMNSRLLVPLILARAT